VECEHFEMRFAAAIEGHLGGDDAAALAAHLAVCPACREAFEETRGVVERLGASEWAEAGAPSLVAAVSDRIIREQARRLRAGAIVRRRIVNVAAAAVVLIAVGLLAGTFLGGSGGKAYADDLKPVGEAVERAKSATWRARYYMRFLGPDGRSSKWVRVVNNNQRSFYKAPGFYRREDLGESGDVHFVAVEDARNRVSLELRPQEKSGTVRYLAESGYSPLGPFATFTEAMKREDLQGLGKREVAGAEADGYRYKFFAEGANQNWSYEFWVDPKTRKLVRGQVPGGDIFDLADIVPDRTWEPSLQSIEVDGIKYELATDLGLGNSSSLIDEIALDVPIDDRLLSLQSPEGYAMQSVAPAAVAEADVIAFLRILARYFQGTFPDRALEFNHGPEYERFERVERDVLAGKGGSEDDVAMVEEMHRWWREGLPGPGPLRAFVTQEVEPGSWKYLGDGVPLGAKDRVVCWYRPKGSRSYRVVRGDLSVEDVAPGDLPLPVAR